MVEDRLLLSVKTYYKAIKKLTGLSADDNRSLLLEYILVYKDESVFFHGSDCGKQLNDITEEEWVALYMENNSVLIEGFKDIIENRIVIEEFSKIPYYLEKFKTIVDMNSKESDEKLGDWIQVYKNIYELLGKPDIGRNSLNELAKNIQSFFGALEIKMFFINQQEQIKYDGYYLLSDAKDALFYSRENIDSIEKLLMQEPILNTIYIGEQKCIVKFSKDSDEEAIYFLLKRPEQGQINVWFKIKLILTLRSRFIQMLERINVINEMSKLNIERKKKALEIEKAHSHKSQKYFEGMGRLFEQNSLWFVS